MFIKGIPEPVTSVSPAITSRKTQEALHLQETQTENEEELTGKMKIQHMLH